MEKTENTHFIDYVTDGMRRSAEELEKFQLQLNLGKAKALEKFGEVKESYNQYTHELKLLAIKKKEQLKELQAKIQDLQVQLSLGKAESREVFEKQKKKILSAIRKVEAAIKSNPVFIKTYAILLEALETLKVKLEILAQKLDPVKEKVSNVYSNRKKELEKIINSFKKKVTKKNRREVFQDEIVLAFNHLKKAFVQA